MNVDNQAIILDKSVAHTPYNKIEWFGFSEEGMIMTYDSNGIIRALFYEKSWTQIFDS